MFFDLPPDDENAGEDQAKKEAMDGSRVIREEFGDDFGEGEDGNADAQAEEDQEGEIDMADELADLALEKESQCGEVEGADACDEFPVDSQNQGHGPAVKHRELRQPLPYKGRGGSHRCSPEESGIGRLD